MAIPTNGNYSVRVPLMQFLDDNGDGTGVTNHVGVNYSVTPTFVHIQPNVGTRVIIHELRFCGMRNSGVKNPEGWITSASAPAGLTNGWIMQLRRSTLVTTPPAAQQLMPVIDRDDIMQSFFDIVFDEWGNPNNGYLAVMKFNVPIILDGDKGDQFGLLGQDSFLDANYHIQRWTVLGVR